MEQQKKISFFSLRSFLNIYGLIAILGFALTIYTHPITASPERGIFFDESLMMSSEKIREFLLFLLIVGVVYFTLVNVFLRKIDYSFRKRYLVEH